MDQSTVVPVLEREMKISVSDADVKKFYDENPAKFEEPEMVRASHILLSTRDQANGVELTSDKKAAKRKLAEDLLKRARAGEDFRQARQGILRRPRLEGQRRRIQIPPRPDGAGV